MCREEENSRLEPQLDFITEVNLSREGMIKEVKTEFDIIRLCLTQLRSLGSKYRPMLDRILVMPLRKLLCEKSSVLLNLLPDFKMCPLTGGILDTGDKLKVINLSFSVNSQENWIPIDEWLKMDIAYFDRTVCDLPKIFYESTYNCIINKLKKADKQDFQSMFRKELIDFQGQEETVYVRVDPDNSSKNDKIFMYLEQVGYNHLTIYNFLKHLSDKRGAHIDIGNSIMIDLINRTHGEISMVLCIAIQMIYVSKVQIPELSSYWPDMPKLEEV